MKKLYFTRHGQTFWNVENKICGATDIALTPLGHEQAVAAGKMIREGGYAIDEILYSPLMRAAETARHISEETGIPMREEPRLKEQNFGIYEGTARNGEEFRRARHVLSIILAVGSQCFRWHRGSTICWMRLSMIRRAGLIFWWRITVLQELCSPIFGK